ncbi:helix-turn-helix transcriptional regulator [Lactobacillus sp.]|uniref:helix-turn-helix domain-containing protein n=1 Tax=Lactobacillus sp. TaxID=1591 RepID=UPI0025D6A94C|nr:helix-turn-helix transcriptional regulator [Lactobacillus sp.]
MKNNDLSAISPIYSRIRDLAQQHKISLAELERSLQFSNGIISTWKFSNPSIDKIQKVANYFNVSTDYLLGNDDTINPADQKILAMFRKQTEGLSEDEKEEFQDSLNDVLDFVRKFVNKKKGEN